ncbi:MAG: hypothetical protein KAH01_02270 [Caldisericia bacterium]|nr:hypothetical protein [Caldisericia bacterium]
MKRIISLFVVFALVFSVCFCDTTIQSSCYSVNTFPDLDGIIQDNEYEDSVSNEDESWSFFYTITNQLLKGGIKAKTNGWCAIGLDPELKMKGGDIIQGWVQGGKPASSDSYATKAYGPHPTDESLGGTNDIHIFTVSQNGEYTVFEFRRKLKTMDKFDKVFPKEGTLKFLWAYGDTNDSSSIHTKRGYGTIINTRNGIRNTSEVTAKVLESNLSNYQILTTSSSFNSGHIPGAILCNKNNLLEILPTIDHTKQTVLYGDNDATQKEILNDLFYYDFRNVSSLTGGFSEWEKNGYPIVIPEKENTVLKFYIGKSYYFFNKKRRSMDVSPLIIEGRTYLPISYVVTPLGAEVKWNNDDKKIQILLDGLDLELWIGKPTALLNGEEVFIDPNNSKIVPLIVPPGRTMLPVRFVAESLGCSVNWDADIREITIEYKH